MKNVFQPHFLKSENRWVCGFGGSQSRESVQAEIATLNAEIEKQQDEQVVVKKAEKKSEPMRCHYCGMPARSFGFFDEPVCSECGG